MVSVCIPLYNRDISDLLRALVSQLSALKENWEIIIADDGSDKHYIQRNTDTLKSLDLSNIRMEVNENNVGNSENRNILARKAKFPWLLFMDSDVLPVKEDFIEKFITSFQTTSKNIVGARLLYPEDKSYTLRVKFGNKHEVVHDWNEKVNPKTLLRGPTFAIRKESILAKPFPELPEDYGYVDTFFFLQFEDEEVEIIDNQVFHLGIDTNEKYMQKIDKAVRNAKFISENYPEQAKYIRLIQKGNQFQFLSPVVQRIFPIVKANLLKNLRGENPSVSLFQLYKLLYYLSLDGLNTLQ